MPVSELIATEWQPSFHEAEKRPYEGSLVEARRLELLTLTLPA